MERWHDLAFLLLSMVKEFIPLIVEAIKGRKPTIRKEGSNVRVYRVPEFNLVAKVWLTATSPAEGPADLDDVEVQRYENPRYQVNSKDDGSREYLPGLWIRYPISYLEIGEVKFWNVPSDSPRYYKTVHTHIAHEGFPNAYLVALVYQCDANGNRVYFPAGGGGGGGGGGPPGPGIGASVTFGGVPMPQDRIEAAGNPWPMPWLGEGTEPDPGTPSWGGAKVMVGMTSWDDVKNAMTDTMVLRLCHQNHLFTDVLVAGEAAYEGTILKANFQVVTDPRPGLRLMSSLAIPRQAGGWTSEGLLEGRIEYENGQCLIQWPIGPAPYQCAMVQRYVAEAEYATIPSPDICFYDDV